MKNSILIDLDGVLVNSYSATGPVPIEEFDADSFNAKIPTFPMNGVIHDLLIDFEAAGRKLIFLTARQEMMRPNTEAWLSRYGWSMYPLIMREPGDMRDDVLYKLGQYLSKIKPKYGDDIAFIIDDKPSIVKAFWDDQRVPGMCFVGGMYDGQT